MDPAINLSQQSIVLGQFHHILLPRVKVNRNFQVALMPVYLVFGVLGFRTVELEQGLEYISHLISLSDIAISVSNILQVSL